MEYRNSKNRPQADEIWCINSLGYHHRDAARIFYMDDMREVPPQDHYAEYLKSCDVPVFTSRAYPEYPTAQDFPINDIVAHIGDDPLTLKLIACTVVHTLIYADYLGVEEISLWGIDCGEDPPELSLATAYTIGRLKGKGMKINVSSGSKLNNITILSDCKQFYGYYKEKSND